MRCPAKGQHGWHAAAALSDRDCAFKETPVPPPQHDDRTDASAKLLLVLLSLTWGVTWPAIRIALREIPPFSMRTVSLALGAAFLLAAVALQRRTFALGRPIDWLHVAIASVLNIIGFTMLSSFALLMAATSRVTILSYTMPIWAALFARLALGERLSRATLIALALCVAGMAILIAPLAQDGIPPGLLLAVATGMSWAAGTVYIKWAQIHGDPIAVAAWQLTIGFLIVAIGVPFVEGVPHFADAHWPAWLATIWVGIAGSGFAYFLWFKIIGRLPAMTASLGLLSVPLIGVAATFLILGERPTLPDIVGFVLIFAAAACVLLSSREAAPPEPS
jgi:drug/metabolite transporter (DMT)-like permease